MNKESFKKVIKTILFVICSLSTIFGLWFILSCEKLDIKRLIRVQTIDITDIRSTYAIVYGTILDVGEEGSVEYGHCWSTKKNFTTPDSYTSSEKTSDTLRFSSMLKDLLPNTDYYVKACARNSKGYEYGSEIHLETKSIGIEWEVCLGGSDNEWSKGLAEAKDGSGYFVAGHTFSIDGDVSGHNGDEDAWVVKLDNTGTIQWQNSLGGSDIEHIEFMAATSDGGCIIAANTRSNNGDVTGLHGGTDIWIVKLNSAGTLEWEKCLGGSNDEDPNWIIQTTDGGYIFTGQSRSNDGDVTGNHGEYDFWTVKLSSSGKIQWQKCLGGSGNDSGLSIRLTEDDGYILTGRTWSNDGDVSGNHGEDDFWVVRLDNSGNLLWQKCLGGTGNEGAKCIVRTADKGYLVTGATTSSDGNISVNKGERDYWIVKLNNYGTILWQNTFGGSLVDQPNSIIETGDEGCIVAGLSNSDDGDVEGSHGSGDSWIIKLSSSGVLQWQKRLGGSQPDDARVIIHTADDGYLVTGSTWSIDGDVSGNNPGRNQEIWVVKLKEN